LRALRRATHFAHRLRASPAPAAAHCCRSATRCSPSREKQPRAPWRCQRAAARVLHLHAPHALFCGDEGGAARGININSWRVEMKKLISQQP